MNKNQTKSYKFQKKLFVVQHSTLTHANGDHDENGDVVRCCVSMQRKQI